MQCVQSNDLLPKLGFATEENKLKWTVDGGTFYTDLSKYRLKIWHWSNPENEIEGVTVQLLNSKNQVVDTVSADEFSPKFSQLLELFNLARRSAFNVEAIISEIDSDLDTLSVCLEMVEWPGSV